MTSHSYWRIRYKYPDGSNIQYAEVYFLDSVGTDLCVGGTVIYSSQFNGTFAAANAFDRNNATNYAALGNVGQWIGYQFASPVDVAKVGVRGSTSNPNENSKGILIERSDDGTNWRCVTSIDDGAGNLTSGEYREYSVVAQNRAFDLDPHRYWRVRPFSLSHSNSAWIIGEIVFRDLSDTDLTVVEGGSTIELNHESTWFASLAFDRINSFGWQKDFPTLDSWVGWDFGAGNEQAVAKIDLRAGASYGPNMPTSCWIEYSDDATNWVIREEINDNTAYANAEWRYRTFATEPDAPEMLASFGFDYSIDAQPVHAVFGFDYTVESNSIAQSFGFDYGINEGVHSSFGFDYRIQLKRTFGFNYQIEEDLGDVLGYRHIFPGTDGSATRSFETVLTGRGINEYEIISDVGPVTYPSSVPLADDITLIHLHFYADYYNRIWVTPEEIRLSNPKIGFEYDFGVWSAYDRPNSMITYTPTDVDGVSFVELGDLPMSFNPVEFKYLHFTIDADAPSQIDGNLFFTFTMGGDGFDLFALVLGVLETLPNEPFTEVWTWSTVMETSRNGTEQRQALRDQPRTQAGYVVQILDEEDRLLAYQQFYSFATRSVLVPFFQYMTKLDADAAIGATRLYFDLSQSDIRADEYIVIFNPQTDEYSIVQVASLNSDGVNLVTPVTFDVDRDTYEVLPGRSMRLPNKSSLGMGAVNGQLTFKGESTSWRDLKRPDSAVTLPEYDGYPVLPYKPIAANNVDETFDSDVSVIDNLSAPPVLRSTFTNPFVEQSKQYFIDREVEMDWWRTFFDYTKGMLRPFLVPTWRDDLPLVEQPTVGDNELITSNTDYIDYWPHITYQWIQIQSDAGVIYRRVESVENVPTGLRISLDENIGITTGVNENMKVSFLNLTRLNEDFVTLEHFVNHTIVTVKTRTVNQ